MTALVPPAVVVVERHGVAIDDEDVNGLAPDEQAAVRGAVATRRREFAAGRRCARAALAVLGRPTAAIPVGAGRQPVWPSGVVGSITHLAGHVAAAVAHRHEVAALGIDIERLGAVGASLVPHVTTEEERHAWDELAGWPTVVFSLKECVHKAVFPRAGRMLGFHDVVVLPGGRVRARSPVAAAAGVDRLEARFAVADSRVAATVWRLAVENDPPDSRELVWH